MRAVTALRGACFVRGNRAALRRLLPRLRAAACCLGRSVGLLSQRGDATDGRRTNERNERTNERASERASERTNERTTGRGPPGDLVSECVGLLSSMSPSWSATRRASEGRGVGRSIERASERARARDADGLDEGPRNVESIPARSAPPVHREGCLCCVCNTLARHEGRLEYRA